MGECNDRAGIDNYFSGDGNINGIVVIPSGHQLLKSDNAGVSIKSLLGWLPLQRRPMPSVLGTIIRNRKNWCTSWIEKKEI